VNIEITIGGPLAEAVNNLAAALQTMGAIEKAAKPKKSPAKAEPVSTPTPTPEEPDVVQEEATVVSITTYEALRAFVAPLLANPDTKTAVAKVIKKFCNGNLKDIKTEDYPAVCEALKEIGK
jgi:hypothetical protein